MRVISFLTCFLLGTSVFAQEGSKPRPVANGAHDAVATTNQNSENSGTRSRAEAPAVNKTYPIFENGSNVPLSMRPLQALNVGSTFQLPGDAANLNFVSGIFTEKGRAEGDLKDDVPYCFIHPGHGTVFPETNEDANKGSCKLKNIEGSHASPSEGKKHDYWTRLTLECRGHNEIEISCHKPSDGDEAKEMTLGEFERIISKKFQFGNLILETPLIETKPNGFPIQNPVTPTQIMSGKLRFKFNDTKAMSFTLKEADYEKNRYQHYLKDGASLDKLDEPGKGYTWITVTPANGTELSTPPNSTDLNDLKITSVESGYNKSHGDYRHAILLVRGKKNIQGVDTDVTIYWTDPDHSHITYEGMWKLPGRKTIDNWYQLGR